MRSTTLRNDMTSEEFMVAIAHLYGLPLEGITSLAIRMQFKGSVQVDLQYHHGELGHDISVDSLPLHED